MPGTLQAVLGVCATAAPSSFFLPHAASTDTKVTAVIRNWTAFFISAPSSKLISEHTIQGLCQCSELAKMTLDLIEALAIVATLGAVPFYAVNPTGTL